MNPITVRPLEDSDLAEAARLLGFLNPDTPLPLVRERLETMLREHPHYQIVGAFDGTRLAGVCVHGLPRKSGAAFIWKLITLWLILPHAQAASARF